MHTVSDRLKSFPTESRQTNSHLPHALQSVRRDFEPSTDDRGRLSRLTGKHDDSGIGSFERQLAADSLCVDWNVTTLDLDLPEVTAADGSTQLLLVVRCCFDDSKRPDERRLDERAASQVLLSIVRSSQAEPLRDNVDQPRTNNRRVRVIEPLTEFSNVRPGRQRIGGNCCPVRQDRRPRRRIAGQLTKPNGRLAALTVETDEFDLTARKLTAKVARRAELDRSAADLLHQPQQVIEPRQTVLDPQHPLATGRPPIRVDVQELGIRLNLQNVTAGHRDSIRNAVRLGIPFDELAAGRCKISRMNSTASPRERDRIRTDAAAEVGNQRFVFGVTTQRRESSRLVIRNRFSRRLLKAFRVEPHLIATSEPARVNSSLSQVSERQRCSYKFSRKLVTQPLLDGKARPRLIRHSLQQFRHPMEPAENFD